MTHADDQALMLNEILDLMDTLQETIGAGMTAWAALRAVLDWGGRHELFTMAGNVRVETMPHGEAEAAALERLEALAKFDRWRERLMPGKTGAPVPGDTGPGTPAAPSSPAAEGTLPPDDAVPARDGARGTSEIPAGGGTHSPVSARAKKSGAVASNFTAPAWTEDQDRTAIEMKLAGRSNREIAEAVGRSVTALSARMSTKLKARLAQARAEIVGERDSETAGEPAPEGGAESGVTAAAQFAENTPAGAAEETGDSPAAAAPTPAAPPPVAPSSIPTPPVIIHRELNALGYKRPWTPALDLKVTLDVTGGASIAEIAADLGFDSRVVKDRWQALSAIGTGMRQVLIEVLRERAGPATEAAE